MKEIKPTLATKNDLDLIIKGLKNNDWVTLTDSKTSFYYLRKEIKASYEMEDLWIILYEGVPVSFLAGHPVTSCLKILNTKKRFDNQGYGSKLVEFYIDLSRKRGATLLWLECRPRWSVPFWQKRKFKLYDDFFGTSSNNQNAIMPLSDVQFSNESYPVRIRIVFYSKMKLRGRCPFAEYNVIASRNSNFAFRLSMPLTFYFPKKSLGGSIRVGVFVDDEVILLNKLSSETSIFRGFIKYNAETYSISQINF